MQNIIRGGLVICKQRNHREQRPNFSAKPLHVMFFLTQNNMQILHRSTRNTCQLITKVVLEQLWKNWCRRLLTP